MRFGKVALVLMIAAAALRCSGNPPVSEPGQTVLSAPSAVVINGIDHAATPAGTEVILHGNYPFSYTSYQPDPNTLVLELLDVHVDSLSPEVSIGTPQVEKVQVSSVESVDGGRIAKFEFHNIMASHHAIRLEGSDLVIDFPSLGDSANAPSAPMTASQTVAEGTPANAGTAGVEPAPEGDAALEPLEMPMDPGAQAGPTTEARTAEPAPTLAPVMEPAAKEPQAGAPVRVTRGAAPSGTRAKTLVSVEARGSDPERSVVLTADGGLAHEHFELQNPPRLVLDLPGVVDRTGTKSLAVDSSILPRVRVAQFATKPRPVVRVVLDLKTPRPYAIVPTENGLVVDFSEEAVRMAATQPATGGAEQAPAPLTAEVPPSTPEDAAPVLPETTEAPPVQVVENAPEDGGAAAPEAPDASASPLLASGDVKVQQPESPSPDRRSASQDVNRVISIGGTFKPRAISHTGPKYTGKRISLNFKDADLKDVFRLFHEITGYNIVLDPGVAGTLTIVLENVPEDQALDIILQNNSLDKVFENNVIRIATTQKLASEAAARKALLEAQELEQQPITFARRLSYAKAKDVTPILKKVMSKRGDAIMDDRTNTLIITDLPDRQDPINRLIDTLDEQTPQVVIEARIVETDREFERDLGILWGASKSTTIDGTTTNLTYDVTLPAPAVAGQLGISYGDVLVDSFTLDATLQAFELNGNVKVLSSPRIATQNNVKATIEQGTQIPVVSTTATQINVEFISASLKLEVTPQITNEGTVIMDIKVDNSSPDFVNRVGDVPPIITERAQTQILVADGGTAVIGGIFKLNDAVTEASVPGLGRIPVLGWLFKNKTLNRKNTELLIFITPRITKKAEVQEERA